MKEWNVTARVAVTACALASGSAFADTLVTTTNGQWDLYPTLAQSYQTQIQPPVAADGSSNFSAGHGTVPVQFALFNSLGPVLFESIGSDGFSSPPSGDDYSYLTFTPNTSITFNQITGLSAQYAFQSGNCHGGSMRWSIVLQDGRTIFIYYGNDAGFWIDCTTPGQLTNQSGLNMIAANFDGNASGGDIRYETSDHPGTYTTYSYAVTFAGQTPILWAGVVLDGGWYNAPNGDQILSNLSQVTFQTAGYTEVFVPPSSGLAQTCTLPQAAIQVVQTAGSDPGAVNAPLSVSNADTTGYFRVVDCKYIYNLDVRSLRGAGSYTINAVIGGTPVLNPANFSLK